MSEAIEPNEAKAGTWHVVNVDDQGNAKSLAPLLIDGAGGFRARVLPAGLAAVAAQEQMPATQQPRRATPVKAGGRESTEHLNDCQRCMAAARMAKHSTHGGSRYRKEVTLVEAAAKMKVKLRQVGMAPVVLQHGIPELVAGVERGWLRLRQAELISRLADADQRAELRAFLRSRTEGRPNESLLMARCELSGGCPFGPERER